MSSWVRCCLRRKEVACQGFGGAFLEVFTIWVVGVGVVNVNGFAMMGTKRSLGAGLGKGISHVVALDATMGLDFEVMY